jgi:hypothetical protein
VSWFDIGDVLTLLLASSAIAYALWVVVSRPERHVGFHESKADVATVTIKKYALEAYPEWATQHPDETCPASLDELSPFMNIRDLHDPWGSPYEMRCGRRGVVVHSLGEDRIANTSDDLWSSP